MRDKDDPQQGVRLSSRHQIHSRRESVSGQSPHFTLLVMKQEESVMRSTVKFRRACHIIPNLIWRELVAHGSRRHDLAGRLDYEIRFFSRGLVVCSTLMSTPRRPSLRCCLVELPVPFSLRQLSQNHSICAVVLQLPPFASSSALIENDA